MLRSDKGKLIDDQTTFVIVELAKFRKRLADVTTDLDKLIYTMKMAHLVTEPTQFPPFWDEDWLEAAIKELDTRAMTPEQRLAYEMAVSANALAVKNENRKLQAAQDTVRTETVQNAVRMGLTVEQAATLANVSVEFVEHVRQKIAGGQ